ncbi:hypothetical protein [Micromonospora sp. NPDC048839]|uniref:hypothetical protein n=1 Tax=Micromonospora sp. NPDC048839 TaxID=3155641 RepID=UPI0033E80E77
MSFDAGDLAALDQAFAAHREQVRDMVNQAGPAIRAHGNSVGMAIVGRILRDDPDWDEDALLLTLSAAVVVLATGDHEG